MTISIEKLRFEAIIGILEFERRDPQPVEIDCRIDYSYRDGEFLDYAAAVQLLESTVKREKFLLLEEALEALFRKMREEFPAIEKIEITISKPDILPNCRVCVSDFRTYL